MRVTSQYVKRLYVTSEYVTTSLALTHAEVSILNMQRSGTVTDEPAAVYHVGASPDFSTRGLHFVSREKYNTWVNGEKDSSKTGQGAEVLQSYSFLHQVWGQTDIIEKILTPTGLAAATGFCKRFALGFFDETNMDVSQVTAASTEFLLGLHNYMGFHVTEKPDQDLSEEQEERHHLDEFAEEVYRRVQQAIKDWAENHKDVHPCLGCRSRVAIAITLLRVIPTVTLSSWHIF